MVAFIEAIAEETGLPVGIKAAIGKLDQWIELADLMKETGKGPKSSREETDSNAESIKKR